jgi:hypothetical protein
MYEIREWTGSKNTVLKANINDFKLAFEMRAKLMKKYPKKVFSIFSRSKKKEERK